MNKKEVKNQLQSEVETLASLAKRFHEEALEVRRKCTESNIKVELDTKYITAKRIQKEYQDKAFQTLHIMTKLGIITEEQEQGKWNELWEQCHRY